MAARAHTKRVVTLDAGLLVRAVCHTYSWKSRSPPVPHLNRHFFLDLWHKVSDADAVAWRFITYC